MTTAPHPPTTDSERRRAVLAWARLGRAYQALLLQTEASVRDHGLSGMEFDILAHVAGRPGLTQQDLASRLFVSQGNVTYQVSKLEERGLLERRPAGRSNTLHLTAAGQAIHDRAAPQQGDLHARQFAALSPEEQAQLTALLRRLHPTDSKE
ncbi:MarR family winged helix-turn-helix transcriptional regulator [Deinococcus sonorensis]|uniref:MarR family winged helix-turn-helix transcriptional regulator n=2 Tax=Deinococcus sonorensis TaxID=309891 RepID=A0AAU7U8J3_9DEIO